MTLEERIEAAWAEYRKAFADWVVQIERAEPVDVLPLQQDLVACQRVLAALIIRDDYARNGENK